MEFYDHIFQSCSLVTETRELLSDWTHMDIPDDLPNMILCWCESLQIPATSKIKFEAILFVWWWHLWKTRNNAVHNDIHESSKVILHLIISLSYLWIHNRDRKDTSSWDSWNTRPIGC